MKKIFNTLKLTTYCYYVMTIGDIKKVFKFCVWMIKRINFLRVIVTISVVLIETMLLYGAYTGGSKIPIINLIFTAVLFLVIGIASINLLEGIEDEK